jgi:hypothetical protein
MGHRRPARQSVRLSSLAGNQRYVAATVQNEELISQILLRTRNEPEDDRTARFHQALDKVREAAIEAKAHTLSATRKEIYQGVLGKLDAQAQSAEKSLDLSRVMMNGRARLFSGGDALTAATSKLVEASQQMEDARDAGLARLSQLDLGFGNFATAGCRLGQE